MNYGNGGDLKKSGELKVLEYVKEKLIEEEKIIIFDGGSNIGNYSNILSDLFKNKAKIYSFEPSKKTFEKFLVNTKGKSNIIANNLGLSDKKSERLLYTNTKDSGLASVYNRNLEHFNISMNKSETIQLSTIDDYCNINKIERIHFLKLDIEGHELNAITGAQNMITAEKINFIQFEFGGCNIDSRTYFQDFFYKLKDNFIIYRILKDGLFEISEYKENLEIFITANYLAEKK